MILGITGPRPNKLGGNILPNPRYKTICKSVESNLLSLNPDVIITGMAMGFDQYTAFVYLKLNIPYIAAIPFIGQEYEWDKKDQDIYNKLLAKAQEVVVVSFGIYSNDKYLTRNRYIVDNSDQMLACYYEGQDGGTQHCVNYLSASRRPLPKTGRG
jgi:uncharacterized phage-like protein YoqJ